MTFIVAGDSQEVEYLATADSIVVATTASVAAEPLSLAACAATAVVVDGEMPSSVVAFDAVAVAAAVSFEAVVDATNTVESFDASPLCS